MKDKIQTVSESLTIDDIDIEGFKS